MSFAWSQKVRNIFSQWSVVRFVLAGTRSPINPLTSPSERDAKRAIFVGGSACSRLLAPSNSFPVSRSSSRVSNSKSKIGDAIVKLHSAQLGTSTVSTLKPSLQGSSFPPQKKKKKKKSLLWSGNRSPPGRAAIGKSQPVQLRRSLVMAMATARWHVRSEIPGVQRPWFRWRCTRNVDRENNSNNDQSPARDLRVYHRFSFIVFRHEIDRSTAGCAGVMQASYLVSNGSIARPQPTLTCTWAHAGHRARRASPFSRPGRVRLSVAGPKRLKFLERASEGSRCTSTWRTYKKKGTGTKNCSFDARVVSATYPLHTYV